MSQFGENPYYPNGGVGGGGYMSGGSQYNSPGGAARLQKAAAQSLRPVTIKQIQSATQAHTDAEWMLDEMEVAQITVVAQVLSIHRQTTNSVYTLDDGTGRIDARHWVDSTMEDDEDPNHIMENSYVRVLGGIKMFGNKRYVNATHLRPSKDPHEIYFHVLDCITSKLLLEKGSPNSIGDVKPQISSGGANGVSAYTASSHSTLTDQYAHLPDVARRIITFMLNQPPNEEGIHVSAIARAIEGSASSISDALDKLLDDGHVFTTLDESHYALSV